MARSRQVAGQGEHIHQRFVLTGLAFTILGGFTLAIVLPLEAAFGVGTSSWVAHAQVHGHLQLVGFVALMIMGVSYHLIPAFVGRPIEHERLTGPSLWLLAGGVIARVVGQPLAGLTAFGVLMVLGALAEFAATICFATIVISTLLPGLRRGDATRPFFMAGALWLALQALLGVWWTANLASSHSTALPASQDSVLVMLQLLGFAVMFILGVGVRSFPVFFGAGRFSFRSVAIPFALWQLGLAAIVARGLIDQFSSGEPWLPGALGFAFMAVGFTWVAACTGWWHSPSRMRPASKPFALPLQLALGWLSLAGVLLLGLAVESALSGSRPPAFRLDAVTHIVTVGVILTTIVAMGQLVLPEFASERFSGSQGAWRGIALGLLLSLAVVLRAGTSWWSDVLPARAADYSMSLAGVIALGVMIAFAALYLRGIRNHRALLARFAAMSERGQVWSLSQERPQERTN